MGFQGKEQRFYEFGSFRIDAVNHLLLEDGRPVSLQPKTFDLLLLLVERAGEVLSKEELMRRLWPETAVEEANLTQNVYLLRKILGQTSEGQKYIETIPKRGYKFTGNVAEVGGESSKSEPALTPLPDESAPLKNPGRQKVILLLLSVIVCLVATAFAWQRLRLRRENHNLSRTVADQKLAPFASVKLSKLTDLGTVFHPTISPDGKYLAYTLYSATDGYSLWVKNLLSEGATLIGTPNKTGYGGLVFAPDGNRIYYESSGSWPSDIYRMPVLGGPVRKIAAEVWSAFAISPDERQVAFVRRNEDRGESILTVADINGGGERQLATRREPESFGLKNSSPAFSPDGQKIACILSNVNEVSVFEFNLTDDSQKSIPLPEFKSINSLVWASDGSGLLMTAKEKTADEQQIYFLSGTEGKYRRITNDLSNYYRLSITADGRRLAAEQINEVTNLWVVPVDGGPAESRQLTFRNSRGEGYRGVSWFPDGRLVFASEQNGRCDLWTSDADGRNKRPLTANVGRLNQQPNVSFDGQSIVFVSDRAGRLNIWVVNADGLKPRQLTFGEVESDPSFTPDGRWVIYSGTGEGGEPAIWKKSVEGDDLPVQLIANGSKPSISPDGKFMTYNFADEADARRIKTAVIALADNKLVRILPVHRRELYHWSPDSKSLAYISEDDSNIWSVPLIGQGAPRQLTHLTKDSTRWFDWSRDGQHLVLVRSVISSDAVLLTDERAGIIRR